MAIVLRIRRLSYILTSKVVNLFETLEAITREQSTSWSRGDKALQLRLTFKPACKEINDLHLTFNSVQHTLLAAMHSFQDNMNEEKLSEAILSYAEAYHIYDAFDKNHR